MITQETPPPCPACRSIKYIPRFAVDTYPLLRCVQCGLERLHPQPSDTELEAIYNEEYQLAADTREELDTLNMMKTMTARLYLDVMKNFDLPQTPKLLEIGCGWGHFISEASRTGFDAYGVELSPHAAEKAKKRLSPERILNTTIECSELEPSTFDIAVMIDVIEHVRDPQEFLNTVGAMLKPGGYIFIVTPSTDSLSAKLMGRHWVEYKAEHLYSFSRKSLAQLLMANDFTNIRILPAKKALNYNFIQAYLERFSVPGLTQVTAAVGKMLPKGIAHRQWLLPAGGIIGIANKQQLKD